MVSHSALKSMITKITTTLLIITLLSASIPALACVQQCDLAASMACCKQPEPVAQHGVTLASARQDCCHELSAPVGQLSPVVVAKSTTAYDLDYSRLLSLASQAISINTDSQDSTFLPHDWSFPQSGLTSHIKIYNFVSSFRI
jgi:hypothetical protein